MTRRLEGKVAIVNIASSSMEPQRSPETRYFSTLL